METIKKIWNSIKDYVYIVIAVVIIRTFLVTPAIVSGESMDNTLENNQIVIVNKIVYRVKDIKRFDIVVVKNEKYNDKIIKRVIGLPGDKLHYEVDENSNCILYVNGEVVEETFLSDTAKKFTCKNNPDVCETEITIPEGFYYVMGDNRDRSADSRVLGIFSKDEIFGRVKYRLTPFSKFGKIEK